MYSANDLRREINQLYSQCGLDSQKTFAPRSHINHRLNKGFLKASDNSATTISASYKTAASISHQVCN